VTFEVTDQGQPAAEYDPIVSAYDFPDPQYEQPTHWFEGMTEPASAPLIGSGPAPNESFEPSRDPMYLEMTPELMEQALQELRDGGGVQEAELSQRVAMQGPDPVLPGVDVFGAKPMGSIDQAMDTPVPQPGSEGLEAQIEEAFAQQLMEDPWH
jgi:hypothetical protein